MCPSLNTKGLGILRLVLRLGDDMVWAWTQHSGAGLRTFTPDWLGLFRFVSITAIAPFTVLMGGAVALYLYKGRGRGCLLGGFLLHLALARECVFGCTYSLCSHLRLSIAAAAKEEDWSEVAWQFSI